MAMNHCRRVLNQPPTEWDAFYHDSLLPKLRALSDRKTFVVSGDFKFSPQTTLFYDVDERDGITYVASSANYSQMMLTYVLT